MIHAKSTFIIRQLSYAFVVLALLSAQPVFAADPITSLNSLGNDLGLDDSNEPLDPDVAFKLDARAENGQIVAHWTIADGHYLYRDKIKITTNSPVKTGPLKPDTGELKNDEFFGKIYVYHHQANASLPIVDTNGVKTAEFKFRYQGCSSVSGICYPPITKTISFDLSKLQPASASAGSTAATPKATTPAPDQYQSEQDQIANSLKSGSGWVTILSFFGFGLLLAFTPCVFPMIPILSSIIVGQGEQLTTRRAFTLSLIYVLAMAVTYTVAGVFAGLFGENIQAAFQNPWILGSFAGVFVLLSLSMFGFYDLQMPASLQSRLTEISNKQQGGTYTGVAIMGFLSALIVGPCVAAPLAGALIYIGQTGDAVLGGVALFALSMGMGAPLIAIGTSAGKLLPKAGAWMDAIKAVFGVMLLAVAIWMLERVIPGPVGLILWALLFMVSAVYMGAFDSMTSETRGWRRLWKGLGLVLFLYGVMLLIGAASGGSNMFQPISGLTAATSSQPATAKHLAFKRIKGMEGLNAALADAHAQGKPVMLDFYADWCVSCKEMETLTFSDPQVQAALSDMVLLQADVTDNDEKDKALYKHFGIIGPPAIIFYDTNGQEKRNYRVVGYMPADDFTTHIHRVLP